MTEHINILNKKSIASAAVSVVLAIGLMVPSTAAFAEPSTEEQAKVALDKLEQLQEKQGNAENDYVEALADQEEAQQKIEQANAQIAEETKKIEGYQQQLGDRARAMYREGETTILDVVLGAASFDEFATALASLDIINQKDAQLVKETKESRAKVEAAKKEAEEQKKVAEEKAAEAKRVKEDASVTISEMQAVYDSLTEDVKEAVVVEEEKRSSANATAALNQIAADKKAEEAASSNSNNNNSSSSNNNSSASKPSSSNNSKPQSVSGNSIVNRAYSQLGVPYKYGSGGPGTFDCSGLVGYAVTGSYGHALGGSSSIAGLTRVTDPKPGDICVKPGHVGIYIGGGQMIHAPQTGDVVKISGVQSGMYYVRY